MTATFEIMASIDDLDLLFAHLLGYNIWRMRCNRCGWRSDGCQDKHLAIVIGAVHECPPDSEVNEAVEAFDAQFDAPIKALDNLTAKKPVGRPRKAV